MSNNGNKRKKCLESRILVSKGHALLDCEIIELLLYAAHRKVQARITAKELMDNLSSIGKVLGSEMDDLKSIKSVNNSTVAVIFCVKEALNRILRDRLKKLHIINNWQKLIEYLRVSIGQSGMENVRIIYLNKKRHLIAEEIQNVGTVDQVSLYIREIIKKALFKGATSIIIAHNHPSGDPKPSKNDIEITQRLSLACDVLGIEMLDHVIITADDYFSFSQNGLL